MGINLRLAASPNGKRNVEFNPVVVATEAHVFGMDPSDPTQYLVPGNGAPAISTAMYYNMYGLLNFRPYDLDQMGSVGAAVKAANGGRRFVWVTSADHPAANAYPWRGGSSFVAGYSFHPWQFPQKMDEILSTDGGFTTAAHAPPGISFFTYHHPHIFYNPDDPDGKPIYLFAETGPSHYGALWRSSDFVTFTIKELSHYNDTIESGVGKYSSFTVYAKRNGPNDFTTLNLSNPGNNAANGVCYSVYSSTDGINYTSSFVPIVGGQTSPDASGSVYDPGVFFDVGSQRYAVGLEQAPGSVNNLHVTVYPIDSATFDKQTSPSKVRLASGWSSAGFPGPTFLQKVTGYAEDGIAYVLPLYGYPSDVNTSPGTGGPYVSGTAQHGLDQQFVDKIVVRFDDVAARLSAPVGMEVSAASGTATIAWKNALPQNTYRAYYGTDATTQATLIGDYSGVTSATFSPGTGRFWVKLVTLDNGVERKGVTLSVYVSSSEVRVNNHIDRVLDDGADPATINRPYIERAIAALDTIGIWNILELWAHPAFGVKHSGNVISKIYDLGTTRLPRSDDYKTTTSATTYGATSVNGGPGWTNANNNSYGYWGSTKRGNTISQKRQLTVVAAYERTQTTDDIVFIGTGPVFGSDITGGSAIIALKHTAGSPGTIEFSLSDETSTKTASVAGNGSGLQVAFGIYDGTNQVAWSNNTAGSAVTTLDPNPDFGKFTGNPRYVLGSLAGARNVLNGSTPDVLPSPFPRIYPFLGSGSVHNYTKRRGPADGIADVVVFTEAMSKFKGQTLAAFGGALNSTQVGQFNTFLQDPASW